MAGGRTARTWRKHRRRPADRPPATQVADGAPSVSAKMLFWQKIWRYSGWQTQTRRFEAKLRKIAKAKPKPEVKKPDR